MPCWRSLSPALAARRAAATGTTRPKQQQAQKLQQAQPQPRGTQRAQARPGRPQGKPAAKPSKAAEQQDRSYLNVTGYPFPLGPFTERRTIRREASRPRCTACAVVRQRRAHRGKGLCPGRPSWCCRCSAGLVWGGARVWPGEGSATSLLPAPCRAD